jgi:hypothetical protein
MGSLLSKKDEEKLSDSINRRLHDEGKKLKNEVKLLLLGKLSRDSGYLVHILTLHRHWREWEKYIC